MANDHRPTITLMNLGFIPPFLRNKYLLASLAFTVWMLFFDKDDVFMQAKRRNELRQIEANKEYFRQQIAEDRKLSEELKNNPAAIEKIAREQYKMKRDDEDLFIIRPEKD